MVDDRQDAGTTAARAGTESTRSEAEQLIFRQLIEHRARLLAITAGFSARSLSCRLPVRLQWQNGRPRPSTLQ